MNKNKLKEAQMYSNKLLDLGKNEATSFTEAALAYGKGDTETAILKARESGKMASKNQMNYFLPSLELLKDMYSEMKSHENEKKIQLELANAREHLATRIRH